MKSSCCNVEFILRGKSKRKGELLLTCPSCKGKWQCREGKHSHAYQVKKKSEVEIKSVHVNGRMTKTKYEQKIREYGSFQKFLDYC